MIPVQQRSRTDARRYIRPGVILRIGIDPRVDDDYEVLFRVDHVEHQTAYGRGIADGRAHERTDWDFSVLCGWPWGLASEEDWLIADLAEKWEPPTDDPSPEANDAP